MSRVDPILTLLLQIAVILTVCRLLGIVGRRLGQTQAVCDMVAGILLGPSLFGLLLPSAQGWLFPQHATILAGGVTASIEHPSMSILYGLSQLGIALYMFLVGCEFSVPLFRGQIRTVAVVSAAGIAVPFVLGAVLSLWLAGAADLFPHAVGTYPAALFMGASMSITAFPVLARIIDEKRLGGTRVGTMALAAGSVDDVIAWCLLATILASLQASPRTAVLALVGGVAYVVFMFTTGRRLLEGVGRTIARDGQVTPGTRLTVLTVMMLSAAFTAFIGIHSVFGAFVAGTIMPRGTLVEDLRRRLSDLTTLVLLPLFFVYSGLNTRITLVDTPWLWMVTAAIVLVAVAGKGLACMLAARVAGADWREAAAVGTLMNARGLVELIMLGIGLQAGVIGPTLFTIMALMAVTTTVMASPLFDVVYGRRQAYGETIDSRAALATD